MDTDTIRRDLDTFHNTADRFTPLVIFASSHDFPAYATKHDIRYKSVMGLFQGIIEESFVIKSTDGPSIMFDGMMLGQESVLLLSPQEAVYGGNREVWLASVDPSGAYLDPAYPVFLGLWHKVSPREALRCDAWTCYPEANAWYVAKMPVTNQMPTCDKVSQ